MNKLQKLQLLSAILVVQKIAESDGDKVPLFSNIQIMQIGLEVAKLADSTNPEDFAQALIDASQILYKEVFGE